MITRFAFAATLAALTGLAPPAHAEVTDFDPGSVVIPMDLDYQDMGMLKAYGLVYTLLKAGVTVHWVIDPQKDFQGPDFTTSSVDHEDAAIITDHGYRGGPFVIDAGEAASALAIVDLWQAQHTTAVHVTTAPFSGYSAKTLVAAPTIGVFADGSEDKAFDYLNAAGIPDSVGQAFPDKKQDDYSAYPDVLTAADVAGTEDATHNDGALFDDAGNPVFCQLMTMHWNVNDVVDEVVAEMRSFLQYPTHLFAECQAVNAIENNVHGHFLTPNGFIIDEKPDAVDFFSWTLPFAQIDGEFEIIGGSEPSYSLPPGDEYFDQDIVMITEAGSPIGTRDVWMTGFIDGACNILPAISIGGGIDPCSTGVGKVSYLGGHAYDTKVPISENPKSQGARLFLNSLFEADCATAEGQPYVTITKESPESVGSGEVTFSITVTNFGPATILNATVTDALPPGSTFDSADGNFSHDPTTNTVTWELGNMSAEASTTVTVTVTLASEGEWTNTAGLDFLVGLNNNHLDSNTVSTFYAQDSDDDGCNDAEEQAMGTLIDDKDTDDDGAEDCDDTCPLDPNPTQDLQIDPLNCGECALACPDLDHAAEACEQGDCVLGPCEDGWLDVDGLIATGCECAESDTSCNPPPQPDPTPDTGPDAGSTDGGEVSSGDAGADSGSTDAGGADATSSDSGSSGDTSTTDGGPTGPDAGLGDTDSGGASSGDAGSDSGLGLPDGAPDGGASNPDSGSDGGATVPDAGASDTLLDAGPGDPDAGSDGGAPFDAEPGDAAGGDGASADAALTDVGDVDVVVGGGDQGPAPDAVVDGGGQASADAGVGVDGAGSSDASEGCDCQTGQGSAEGGLASLLAMLGWIIITRRRRDRWVRAPYVR